MMLRTAVAALVFGAGIAVAPASAHAAPAFTISDSFEDTASSAAADRWFPDGAGPGVRHSYLQPYDPPSANTGTQFAHLSSTGTETWVSIGRSVRIPATYPRCTARMAVDTIWGDKAHAEVWYQIEVIDAATWTYITTKAAIGNEHDGGYHNLTSPGFAAGGRTVFIRLVMTSLYSSVSWVNVDDLYVLCTA
ncbi:hypothetical protein [Dactylosporangium sp. CS-033363]|uniref:hypothetical protein n=1 Tax=Dactylosporangium sp. CS-033363 TaxID=3239935 RepID=UPI003D9100CF